MTLETDKVSGNVTAYAKWSQLHATASDLPGEEDIIDQGECGDNLTWSFDKTTGILSITGEGEMYDYKYDNASPWSTYKDSINTVIMRDGITTIGDFAFYECRKVTNASIPFGVSEIGECAFYWCSSLTDITIPDSVVKLGNLAFSATRLTSITIPDSITEVGEYLFGGCGALKEVTVPGSIKDMNRLMFFSCGALEKVVVSEGVEIIGESTFEMCSKLTDVTLPESLKSIGTYAFSACTELKNIKFAGHKSQWESIEKMDKWDYMMEDYQVSYGKYDIIVSQPENGTLAVDKTIASAGETVTVTAVANEGYELDAIIVNGVELTGNTFTATADCVVSAVFTEVTPNYGECGDSLTWTYTADNVIIISGTGAMYDYEFDEAYNSTAPWMSYADRGPELKLEKGITHIGANAFNKAGLTGTLTIPDTVVSIGNSAFFGNSSMGIGNLTGDLVIPDSVTTIGSSAFSCLNMTGTLTLSENLTSIGAGAFNSSKFSGELVVPGGVKTIETPTFVNNNFTKVVLCEGVEHICAGAFSSCKLLEEVTIPATVYAVDESAFGSCTSLTDVYYGGSQSMWDEIAVGSDNEYLLNANIVFAGGEEPPAEKYTVTVNVTENCHYIITNETTGEIAVDYVFEASYGDVITIESDHPACHSVRQYIVNEDSYPMNPVTFTVTGGTEIWVEYDIEHISGTLEQENIVEATCTAEGSYEEVGYCEACNEEIHRVTMSIPMLPHTEDTREEDVVEPTCTEGGSYYEVLYCMVCDTEFSSTLIETAPLGHSYEAEVTPPTETEQGYTTHTCSVCGDSYVDNYTDPTGPSEKVEIEVDNTATTAGATVTEPEGGWTEGENTFTVSAEKPCVVVVSYDGGQTYVKVKATATGTDGTYSFTADLNAQAQVAVAVAGDTDGNGKINIIDCVQLKAATLGTKELGALNKVTCDTDGNGKINIIDCVQLKAATLGTRQLTW